MTNRKKNIIDLTFQAEANEILNAKEISRVMNNTKNIRSSGNQTKKYTEFFPVDKKRKSTRNTQPVTRNP